MLIVVILFTGCQSFREGWKEMREYPSEKYWKALGDFNKAMEPLVDSIEEQNRREHLNNYHKLHRHE